MYAFHGVGNHHDSEDPIELTLSISISVLCEEDEEG